MIVRCSKVAIMFRLQITNGFGNFRVHFRDALADTKGLTRDSSERPRLLPTHMLYILRSFIAMHDPHAVVRGVCARRALTDFSPRHTVHANIHPTFTLNVRIEQVDTVSQAASDITRLVR
jgi:hypothetical protein